MYEVWIRNQSTIVNPFLQATRTSTAFYPSQDLGIGRYNLWVRAIGPNNVKLPWTPQYNFQIKPGAVFRAVQKYQTTARPTLNWNALPGAVEYDLWIDNLSTRQSQIFREPDHIGTSWTSAINLPMGSYRAWIRGLDAAGTAAKWSISVEFEVVLPATPISPLNPTFDRTPTFTWTAVSGAVAYDLVLRNTATGAIQSYPKNITATTWTQPTELPIGQFRWYVYAVSSSGLRSFTAATADFFVVAPPGITAPPVTTTDRTPTFAWMSVRGADSYELFVTRVDVLTGGIINQAGITSTNYTPTTQLPTGSYRAWVRSVSAASGTGPWGPQANFLITATSAAQAASSMRPMAGEGLLDSVLPDAGTLLAAVNQVQQSVRDRKPVWPVKWSAGSEKQGVMAAPSEADSTRADTDPLSLVEDRQSAELVAASIADSGNDRAAVDEIMREFMTRDFTVNETL